MGFSHVAAGGVLFFAAAMAGFQISADAYDQQGVLLAAWDDFHDQREARAATTFTVDDVQRFGMARTEVTLTNTGSTTIDAATMTLLYDGVPESVTAWTVDGAISDVWAPGTELILETAAADPDDVVAMDGIGIKAYWRR